MSALHPEVTSDDFRIARSNFIDAHNKIEEIICKRLLRLDVDKSSSTLTQKIAHLKAVKASPKYSKKERERVGKTLDRFALLNEIRCDIVHSPLRIVCIDRKQTGCFINPRSIGKATRCARLVSLDDFAFLTRELGEIAKDLALEAINPASSPPPPSQGAASGP